MPSRFTTSSASAFHCRVISAGISAQWTEQVDSRSPKYMLTVAKRLSYGTDMAIGLSNTAHHAVDEEARAEVEMLNSRLDKTTQLTRKIQASLGRLETSGQSVRDVAGPLSSDTRRLQLLGNSKLCCNILTESHRITAINPDRCRLRSRCHRPLTPACRQQRQRGTNRARWSR